MSWSIIKSEIEFINIKKEKIGIRNKLIESIKLPTQNMIKIKGGKNKYHKINIV